MKIEKAIKSYLLEVLEFTDKIVEAIDKYREEQKELITKIEEGELDGEDMGDEMITHNSIIVYLSLLNDDLRQGISQLIVYYGLAKIGELDLGLEEKDIKRLDFMLENNESYFVFDKGELIARRGGLFEKIVARVKEKKETVVSNFREGLKYKEDNEKGKRSSEEGTTGKRVDKSI